MSIQGYRGKILIIDDSPVQAKMLGDILGEEYDLTMAHSAEEGLHYAQAGTYDVVLLDVVMPEVDGFVLLKMLQEEIVTQHTPVILITSLSDLENEERGLNLGAVDYITKPYHPPIVRARVRNHVRLRRYQQQIEYRAMIDPMTGVPNRRSFDTNYYSKWRDAIRLKIPISLCMLDIDRFKVYNDTFGHPAGDRVIRSVAQMAMNYLRRSTDFFARYGGEEFVGIILGNEAPSAYEQMMKICHGVESLRIPHNPEVSKWVTISVGGVTVCPKMGDPFDASLKMADNMLYQAKSQGRNRVVWSEEK